MTCSAPEGVDLALSELWSLSSLSAHPNIIRFTGAYLETDGQFELLKHGDRKSTRYRQLVEVIHNQTIFNKISSFCKR